MDPASRDLLRSLLGEFRLALRPLERAVSSPRQLALLLGEIGWHLDGLVGADGAVLLGALGELQLALDGLIHAADEASAATALSEVVDRATAAWLLARGRLPAFAEALLAGSLPLADDAIREALVSDLLAMLLMRYLARRQPMVLQAGRALGLIADERADEVAVPGRSGPLRYAMPRVLPRLERLQALGADPASALLAELRDLATAASLTDLAGLAETRLTRLAWALQEAAQGLRLQLDIGRITLSGLELGLVDALVLPLPEIAGVLFTVELQADSAALRWMPEAAANEPVNLFDEAGFSLAALPVAAGSGATRGLTLALADGRPELVVAGGFALGLPPTLLALDGGQLEIAAQGEARFRPGEPPRLVLARAEATLDGLSVGGADGPRIDGRLVLEQLVFPLPPGAPACSLEVSGELGFAGQRLGVRAWLDADGLRIDSSGELDLGSGIRLAPPADGTPVLSAALAGGAGGLLVATIAGRLQLAELGADLALAGSLEARVDGGALRIEAIALASSVIAELALPGGVTLRAARLAVDYAGDAARLGLAGRLAVPDASGTGVPIELSGKLMLDASSGEARIASAALASELLGSLALPGGLQLLEASAQLGFADDAFEASVAGRLRLGEGMALEDAAGELRLAAALAYDSADPQRIRLAAELAGVGLNLGEQLRIFNARLALVADSGPGGAAPSGTVTFSDAAAGLFARSPAAVTPEDFQLAVSGLAASLAFGADGFALSLTAGTLALPPQLFASDGGGTPSVALSGTDVAEALQISFRHGSAALDLQGRLVFRDFGLALPGSGAGGASIHLERAELRFAGLALPELADLDGEVRLPLPDEQRLVVALDDLAWPLGGLPSGRLSLAGDIAAIPIGGGFELGILASDPEGQGRAPGLEFTPLDGQLHFLLEGGLRLGVPAELVSADDPGGPAQLAIAGWGTLAFASDAAVTPRFEFEALRLSASNLRFGGEGGLVVREAEATLAGLDALVNAASGEILQIDFSGELEVLAGAESFRLGLEGARFRFPDGPIPQFELGGLSLGSSAPLFGGLLRLSQAGLRLREPGRALLPAGGEPALLAPDNIELTFSAELAIDSGNGLLVGGVEDTVCHLDADGLPVIDLDGFSVGIDGLDVGITRLTGALAIRGLSGSHAPRLVGKLGGELSGTGLDFLCAVGLREEAGLPLLQPLGACLDVSGGAAGITLAYGFVVNGASGGISFQNSNASPCDFKAYLGIADDGSTVAPHDPPAGPDGVGAPPASQRPLPHGDCPAPCPPASMNPLCQPHPDAARYPNRPILRFSSLDPALLESLGVRSFVEEHFPDLPSLDLPALEDLLLQALRQLLPLPSVPVTVPDPALQSILDDPLAYLVDRLVQQLAAAAQAAGLDADPPTPWQLLSQIAQAGIPCPDVTLQVTGTFSYTGVSAFASVTGGVTVSSTGAIGVLGSLNLIGIPVGQLRGFVILTDASGEPDPSLCGDLRMAVGPLELGQLGFTEYFMGDIHALTGQLAAAASAAGLPLQIVAEELARLLPAQAPVPGADPWPQVQALTLEQSAALLGRIAARLVAGAPEADAVRAFLLELLGRLLTAYDPRAVMCGEISPRLFGLPLAGEGLVAFRGWGSPRDIGGMLAFSPSYLIGRVLPLADFFAGWDRAALGFSMAFPDPAEILLDLLRGEFASPDALLRQIDAGVEHLLEAARFTFAFDLAPFGLSIARSAGRVLLPRLTPHPADPDTPAAERWANPDDDPQLPGRLQVLAAAVAGELPGGRLADVLWDGRLDDLEIPGQPWPAGEWQLGRDYFPHGGLVGAGYLQLPRALAEAPPLALLGTVLDAGAAPLERLASAMEYVQDYLVRSIELGQLAFYLPAPAPPVLRVDGEPIGPRRFFEDLAELDLAGLPLAELPAYPAHLAFLRGQVELALLGVPIADARIEAVPPAGPGASGRLEVRAAIPAGSWLAALVDHAELVFEFTQPPPLPLAAHFEALAAALSDDAGAALQACADALAATDAGLVGLALGGSDAGDDGPADAARIALEGLARRHAEGAAGLQSQAAALAPLWQQARTLAANGAADAATAVDAAMQPVIAAIVTGLPKIALQASAGGLHLPPPLSAWLALDASEMSLQAWSPCFDPLAAGDDAEAEARRRGGIVLRAGLRLAVGSAPALELALPGIALALLPAQGGPDDLAERLTQPPRLRARHALGACALPGTPLSFDSAWLTLDSAPASGGDTLRIGGELAPLSIGKLALVAADGGALRAELRARPVPGQPLGALDLAVDACLLRLPLLAATSRLRLHGADGPDAPATFATSGPWSLALTVEALELVSPYDPDDPPLLAIDPAAAPGLRLEGEGLARATLVLTLPAGAATLFPAVPALAATLALGCELRAGSDGEIAGTLALPPLQLGVLRLHGTVAPDSPITVRMRDYGLGLPTGFRASLVGLSDKRLRLRACVVDGFGHFSVAATSRSLPLGDWFTLSCSRMRLWNGPAGAGLSLHRARVRLLPQTPLRKAGYLSLGIESLEIASDGSFAAALDGAELRAPGLPTLAGRLEFGNQPLPGQPFNPYLRLAGARISAPPLPELQLDLMLSPERSWAGVHTEALELGGLLGLAAGDWVLDWVPGGALTLSVAQLGASLLGVAATLDSLQISVSGGSLRLDAEADGEFELLPGLCGIAGGAVALRLSGGGASLELRVRALPAGANWRIDTRASFGISASRIEASLGFGSGLDFIDLPGLLEIVAGPASRLAIARGAAGWSLAIEGLTVKVLGHSQDIDTPALAAGTLALPWPTSSEALPLGPFGLTPPAALSIRCNLLEPGASDIAIGLPADCTLSSALAAWPADGVSIAEAFEIPASGNFSRSLSPFAFHGILLAADATITLARAEGAVSLEIVSSHTPFGVVAATLNARVGDDGSLTAKLSGYFDLSSLPAPFNLDLGSLLLAYDPAIDDYPFRADALGLAVCFGASGAKVCVVGHTLGGDEVLGPCHHGP